MKKIAIACVLASLITLGLNSLHAEEIPVKLKSKKISYSENGKIMIAEGNVSLQSKEFQIKADKLNMDIQNNLIWATGDIWIKKGDSEFKTSALMLNLEESIVTVNQIEIEIIPPENKGNIFLSAETLTDTPSHQYGKNLYLSTCSNKEHPHHYIYAQSFTYYPNKKFVIKNGYFVNKFLITPLPFEIPYIGKELYIPIIIPLPYYRYALGERKVVWNFPTIGKLNNRPGWGNYIQNTIDYKYENNKESSIYLDFFEDVDKIKKGKVALGNWSIGAGINHFYKWKSTEGNIGFYKYDFEKLNKQGLYDYKTNESMYWNNLYTLNSKWSIDHTLSRKNSAEKIQSASEEKSFYKRIQLKKEYLGDNFQIEADHMDNESIKSESKNLKITKSFNEKESYTFNFNERSNSFGQTDIDSSLSQQMNLPYKLEFKNHATFDQIKPLNQKADNKLDVNSSLIKTFNQGKLSLNFSESYDMDNITRDIRLNDKLIKVPEFLIDLNQYSIGPFKVKQDFTLARYREYTYDPQNNTIKVFPQNNFEIIPNTYIYNQRISVWRANFTYNQYAFKVPEKGLFEGDAQYRLQFNITGFSQKFLFDLFETGTNYQYQYSAEKNNSPFTIGVTKLQGNRNEITQYLDLNADQYKETISLKIHNEVGYNWLNKTGKKWGNHTYAVNISAFNNKLTLDANGSKKMNYSKEEKNTRFDPLSIRAGVNPENFELDYTVYVNMNKWVDENDFFVEGSNIGIALNLGKQKDYQWKLRADYFYQSTGTGSSDLNLYKLNTVSLIKMEHERELSVSYTASTKTWYITYKFLAFPEDALQIKKNPDILQLEGRFQQNAQERL